MPEFIVLDPQEVATARTEVDITPWVSAEGIDWGDAEIAAYMADQARGSSPVDFRVPNRMITVPLALKASGGTTFAQARSNVQAKAALFQQEGGWIKRLSSSGGTVFADVVNATLKLSGSWLQAHRSADVEASLVLEAIPDFYGAEIQLPDHTETTATEIVFTETGIQGNYPARTRIVVDDDSANNQLGVMWSLRSRHYSAASTAAARYEAENLTPLDAAARAALVGASGGTVVTHSALATNWTPVLNTNMGTVTFLTHTGTNRLFARYRTTSGTAVQLRAVYDVGDMTAPVENTGFRAQAGTAFYIGDLGEVRLDPSPVGVHRWQGQIHAKGDTGTENVSIDKLWILNVDEGFGKVTAPQGATSGLAPFLVRDEFNQAAGALAGKTAAVGGVWGSNGDADDFTVETTGKTAQRTAVSDATTFDGRFAYAPTSYTDSVAQVDFMRSVSGINSWSAVLLRVVTILPPNTYFMALHNANGSGSVRVECFSAGVSQFAAGSVAYNARSLTWHTIKAAVDTGGRWWVWIYPRGANPGSPILEGQSSLLATGGALASGRVGFYDSQIVATANTRNYDNFAAWASIPDAAVFASRSAQISTDGIRRLDSAGVAYGPVADPGADLPRLPPSGLEARPTEVFVKASRGDFASLPDLGIDDISARVNYRPSWLFVP